MNAADPFEVLELAKAAIRAMEASQATSQVKAAALDTAAAAIRSADNAQTVATLVAAQIRKNAT